MTVAEHAYRLRQIPSRPVLDTLNKWQLDNQRQVVPNSLIDAAIRYALGQWGYQARYIDDGSYGIDNDLIERDISHLPQAGVHGCSRIRSPAPAPSSLA